MDARMHPVVTGVSSRAIGIGPGRLPGKRSGAADAIRLLCFLVAAAFGVFVAYLIVEGQWYVAALLIALPPAMLLLHRYPFGAVIVWLLLMPFLLHSTTLVERQGYWLVHRAMPPLTIAMMLAASAAGIYKRRLPRLGVPELAMAGYVGLSLGSIFLTSANPLATAYVFYDRVFIPFCLYLIVRLSAFGRREMTWLVIVAFFVALTQVVIGTLSWVALGTLPSAWLEKQDTRTVGSLIHPGVYTSTLAWSGLLMLHVAPYLRRGLVPTVLKLAFLLSLYGIFISFQRAGWLVGLSIILGLLYLYPRYTARLVLAVSIPIVLLAPVLLSGQLSWAEERLYSDESARSAASRLPVAWASARMFAEKPLFGWGYENFDVYDRDFYRDVVVLPSDNKDHASHNLFLRMIAEQGIVGLLLFVSPMIWWLRRSLKLRAGLPRSGFWSKKLLAILWLAILGHVIVNTFADIEIVYEPGMWWITLALVASLVSTSTTSVPSVESSKAR